MLIHVVRQGDTVSAIARQYGVSPQRILSDNGLAGLPYLVVGQALIIMVPQTVHVVRAGETLQSVAALYGLTPIQLMQRNPVLVASPQLRAGERLAIRFWGQTEAPALFNGYAYPYISRDVLTYALPFLSHFTVFSYGFTDDGALIPVDDEELIALALRYRAAPILLLSSITADGGFSGEKASLLFNDTALQNTVIENMLAVMQQKGYLGVDIDFEYINPDDAAAYISFLQNVTSQMHQYGFTVNVDLAPKTSSTQQGLLYEAHNYAAIGAVADTVLIMTYEWGYTYGPPMAVAPLPNVRQVATYAVSEIPPQKILLGIPNYGYDWPLPYQQGVTRATSIGNEQAVQIAAQNGAEIQFDERAQSPYFSYRAASGQEHVVWFEDVRSIEGKFGLMQELGLLGCGYWNLMRPFNQNWALASETFGISKLEG